MYDVLRGVLGVYCVLARDGARQSFEMKGAHGAWEFFFLVWLWLYMICPAVDILGRTDGMGVGG